MTDLCWTCQRYNALIFRSANMDEVQKCERVQQQEEHLRIVQLERSVYNTMVKDAQDTCKAQGITELDGSAPCSRPVSMHYSFDYAQQVHLPSNPLQPGPIYFLVPRKVGLFGVCCEGLPRQVNFLIDEAHVISKRSNAVVSYLHYFFEHFGLGETNAHLHCDNCAGQNKNRFVLWYCAWRVAIGLHKSITLNFLVPGHTKFAPDWCFGLLKQAFRRHAVSSLSCLETVVNGSADTNVAQLVGKEDGTTIVPLGDWQTHLDPHFQPFHGLKKYHHFRFDAAQPGMMHAKITADGEEVAVNLFSRRGSQATLPTDAPPPVPPPGLDLRRQHYLHNNIREFVEDPWKDIMCPQPSAPCGVPQQNSNLALNTVRGRGRGRGRGGHGDTGVTAELGPSEGVVPLSDAVNPSRGRGRGGRGRGGGCGRGQRRNRSPSTSSDEWTPSSATVRGKRGRNKQRQ